MKVNLLLIFSTLIFLIQSLSYDITDYYLKKTLDEIRYITLSLETYLKQYDAQIDSILYSINQKTRYDLIEYSNRLLAKYGETYLPSLDSFQLHIKIFPITLSVKDIINNGEKYNLFIWAFNAEKYERKQNKTSDYIGGINDYGSLLSKEVLIKFIKYIIKRHPKLEERSVFDKEILNIGYTMPEIIMLLRDSSVDQLKAYYYQLGIYLSKKTGKEDVIDHELIFKDTEDKYNEMLGKAIWEQVSHYEELKDYDNFYENIINKNLLYTHPEVLVANIDKQYNREKVIQFALTCEEYHNQYYNSELVRLKNIQNYIEKIPRRKVIRYIMKEIQLFPELTLENFKEEYQQNKEMSKVNQFSSRLSDRSRSNLIEIYLHIQYLLNNTNKYNDDLGTIFRLKDFELRNKIKSVINSKDLTNFLYLTEQLSNIMNESLQSFISKYPNIALKYWYNTLLKYRAENENKLAAYVPSTRESLIQSIIDMSNLHDIEKVEQFRIHIDKDKYTPLYGGIIDYLRTINAKVLLTWLRKFEGYHRNQKQIANIQGGSKDSNTNLTKIDIINTIMTYISIYPQFNDAVKFDQFTQNRFHYFYPHKAEFIKLVNLASSLDGYQRRMNPQLTYDKLFYEYIKDAKEQSQDTWKAKEKEYCNAIMYFLYTVSVSYPELSNDDVFTKAADEINYLDISLTDYLSAVDKTILISFCQNLEKYTNAVLNEASTIDFKSYNEVGLILYFTSTYNAHPHLKEKSNLFRLLNDQIDYLYWNVESYLNRQNERSIRRIMNSIDKHYNIKNDYEDLFMKDLKDMIKKNMTIHPELYKEEVFTEVVDSIEVNKQSTDLYDKIKKLNRNRLTVFALTAEYIYSVNDKILEYNRVTSHLYTVTNNELIRYILYGTSDEDITKDFDYTALLLMSNSLDLINEEDNLVNKLG